MLIKVYLGTREKYRGQNTHNSTNIYSFHKYLLGSCFVARAIQRLEALAVYNVSVKCWKESGTIIYRIIPWKFDFSVLIFHYNKYILTNILGILSMWVFRIILLKQIPIVKLFDQRLWTFQDSWFKLPNCFHKEFYCLNPPWVMAIKAHYSIFLPALTIVCFVFAYYIGEKSI